MQAEDKRRANSGARSLFAACTPLTPAYGSAFRCPEATPILRSDKALMLCDSLIFRLGGWWLNGVKPQRIRTGASLRSAASHPNS
jgi:hypothetical protein